MSTWNLPSTCGVTSTTATRERLAVLFLATVVLLSCIETTFSAETDDATGRRRQSDASASPSAGTVNASATSLVRDYHFDGKISRNVLENYLDRSVTMAYFLVTGKTEGNRQYPYRNDDVRLIHNIGAKFIGRAIHRWNGESRLNDADFWEGARRLIHRIHARDPDVIFQGCLFETISTDVNRVKIPDWVFVDFELPVEARTFSYEAMLNKEGKLVRHWGKAAQRLYPRGTP